MSRTAQIVLILVVAAAVIFGISRMRGDVAPDTNGELPRATHNDIVAEQPRIGQVISSPLTVSGQARGSWFFEASFPVTLQTASGRTLINSFIMTAEEWMTTDFIQFEEQFQFEMPTDEDQGVLILHKDNPSGLPEHDDELRIPVRFR